MLVVLVDFTTTLPVVADSLLIWPIWTFSPALVGPHTPVDALRDCPRLTRLNVPFTTFIGYVVPVTVVRCSTDHCRCCPFTHLHAVTAPDTRLFPTPDLTTLLRCADGRCRITFYTHWLICCCGYVVLPGRWTHLPSFTVLHVDFGYPRFPLLLLVYYRSRLIWKFPVTLRPVVTLRSTRGG